MSATMKNPADVAAAARIRSRVTLKSLKIHASLSEETTAFSATILVDGKPIGGVVNHGQGACNAYHFAKPEHRATFDRIVDEWASLTGNDFESDDALIGTFLAEEEERKENAKDERYAVKQAKTGKTATLALFMAPHFLKLDDRTEFLGYGTRGYVSGRAEQFTPDVVARYVEKNKAGRADLIVVQNGKVVSRTTLHDVGEPTPTE